MHQSLGGVLPFLVTRDDPGIGASAAAPA